MEIGKLIRLKIQDNFYLDEFIHPEIYKKFGTDSILYLNKQLPDIAQKIRNKFNEERKLKDFKAKEIGIFINTWATGGDKINSGVRDFFHPHKKGSRSRHYFSMCMDLHLNGEIDERELYDHILRNKNYYSSIGITTLENYKFTPGWVHVSIEWRNGDGIKIINP